MLWYEKGRATSMCEIAKFVSFDRRSGSKSVCYINMDIGAAVFESCEKNGQKQTGRDGY